VKSDSTFAEIYELHYEDLWLYCLRRTFSPADAEDVLGEAFSVAWQKFDELSTERDARPWLFTIAANILRNHNRKHARREGVHLRLISDAERFQPGDLNSPEAMALDESNEISAAFRSLRTADQEVLALAAWEELSSREIGVVIGCSELAARSRLHRARKKFERSLDKMQRFDTARHSRGSNLRTNEAYNQ